MSMSDGTPQPSRNGTPLPDVEHLELAPTPTRTIMTQNNSAESPTPPSTPSLPTTLNFNFSKGSAPQKPAPKIASKLSNSVITIGDDENSDDDVEFRAVTHLEDGAIIGDSQKKIEEKKPLVIKPPAYSEPWLQRRLKMFKPGMVDEQPQDIDLSTIPDQIGNETISGGLQVPTKPLNKTMPTKAQKDELMQLDAPQQLKSEDDLARELLLQRAADPSASTTTNHQIIIPAALRSQPLTEQQVFAYDMAHLSDAPTLETYKRVPVEAFGMGILLGLGWKEGTDLHGQKMETVKEPAKRPDFLGIGAKEEAFLRIDAATGKKISRKEGLGALWNPLKKVDKITGEVISKDDVRSGRSTPRGRSGVSTPRNEGSRYSSPGYESSRDRRKGDDCDRRKDKYHGERYDSDRESKRKDREYASDRRRDREYDSDRERKRKDHDRQEREYDSDYERKRRREREKENGSRRLSQQPSPVSKRSQSPHSRRDR
jgi:hypothetical protein